MSDTTTALVSLELLDFEPDVACEARVVNCTDPGAHWWLAHCAVMAVCEKHHRRVIEDVTLWGNHRGVCNLSDAAFWWIVATIALLWFAGRLFARLLVDLITSAYRKARP